MARSHGRIAASNSPSLALSCRRVGFSAVMTASKRRSVLIGVDADDEGDAALGLRAGGGVERGHKEGCAQSQQWWDDIRH
jgi:hypothetical protein